MVIQIHQINKLYQRLYINEITRGIATPGKKQKGNTMFRQIPGKSRKLLEKPHIHAKIIDVENRFPVSPEKDD